MYESPQKGKQNDFGGGRETNLVRRQGEVGNGDGDQMQGERAWSMNGNQWRWGDISGIR